jgi:predicted dehydrogenase
VQTGHVERFNRAVRAALPYVDAPRFIESDRLAPFSLRGADVAVVLDLMIHDIDLVRTLVGSAVSEVRATGSAGPDAHGRHRERAPAVRVGRGREHHVEPRVARAAPEDPHLPAERLPVARPGRGRRRVLPDAPRPRPRVVRPTRGGRRGGAPVAPLDISAFVERVPLEAPDGEPLRLEFESFVSALRGDGPVPVSGDDGREALEVALRIVAEIERTMPALRGAAPAA